MRKLIPYLIGFVMLVALVFLFRSAGKPQRTLNTRITLNRNDKIPYGAWVAYHQLPALFPNAKISVNRSDPGYLDSLSNYESGQALIILTPRFQASEDEMQRLVKFAEAGNDVFISAAYISSPAENMMGCYTTLNQSVTHFINDEVVPDTMTIHLQQPPFGAVRTYSYPGLKFEASFVHTDSMYSEILGTDNNKDPDFIRMQAGQGHIYLHLAPMAFSNYFLLNGQNLRYYEQVLSVISPDVKKIAWDEYYLRKRGDESSNGENWLSELFRHPALRAALLTAMLALLVFVILEMRRKQRPIPVMAPPRNDSLDFVKTIGRLYYDKADHKNLCRKMGAYFLEHVRTRYKLPTGNLDEAFMQALQFKSGAAEYEIRGIVTFIKYTEDAPAVTADELAHFHSQLESFYQKA